MRPAAEYRNYSHRARALARMLDLAVGPVFGRPGPDVRQGTAAAPPSRVLLIRPDHAGDLLMASPAIRALRKALPKARIDLLASPWGAPAGAGHPDLDAVRTIEATWFEPGRREGPDPSRLITSLIATRLGRYDAAADLRGDFRSILIARASGARRRAGFSRIGLEALLTDAVPLDPAMDHVSRNHAVVSLLGAHPLGERRPIYAPPEAAERDARRLLAPLAPDRPLLAVFPGTNRPRATWGAPRFAEACWILRQRRGVGIVIGGRDAERGASEVVAGALGGTGDPPLDLTGRTDFGQAAAVIGRVSALLTNDSAAAHLAVAAGTPVAVIFGPSDPAKSWTWDRPDRYVALAGPSSCPRPCFRTACTGDHGYGAVSPTDVASLLERLIAADREEGAAR